MAGSFRVEKLDGDGASVALSGVVDEHADLTLFEGLQGRVQIHLRGIRRINSFGVRAWIQAMKRVPPETQVELWECSPAVVDQINMIAGFVGRAKVVSFLATMACTQCSDEEVRLYQSAECRRLGARLPPSTCAKCGAPLESCDLEQQYLHFLTLPE